VLARHQGRPVAINYGSAAGELAACVRRVGLACCSELTKLAIEVTDPEGRDLVERLAGGAIAPRGMRYERGAWWAAIGTDHLVVLCDPSQDEALRDQLCGPVAEASGVHVHDRTADWAAIAVLGRDKDRVLGELGVYGPSDDPRQVPPLTIHPVAGAGVLWLLQSGHQALALMRQANGAEVWRAIENAGRQSGICAVGKDALTRFALLHHEPAL
jgi:glycine cleavage system aminomethyltransferase T